ncbi:MAG: WhiB family transcriptional regulator [bacterium]|nr:WhiB family transcriptional regulator [bacterium]
MGSKKVVDIRAYFGEESTLDLVSSWLETGPSSGWEAQAACREGDVTDLFFPPRGGSCRPAKAICSGCPVRSDCLAAAIANDERDGVWGGLNTEERDRLEFTLGAAAAS